MPEAGGSRALLYLRAKASVGFDREPMLPCKATATFRIANPARRLWDPGTRVTVEISRDGAVTWEPADPVDVEHVVGQLRLPGYDAGIQVRASGRQYPLALAGEAEAWRLTTQLSRPDISTLGSSWQEHTTVVAAAEAALRRCSLDPRLVPELGRPLLAVLYVNEALGARYQAVGRLSPASLARVGADSPDLHVHIQPGDLAYAHD